MKFSATNIGSNVKLMTAFRYLETFGCKTLCLYQLLRDLETPPTTLESATSYSQDKQI